MKLLISLIVVLFAAVGLSLILKQDPGYVLLTIGDWTVETSVAFTIFFLAVAFVLLYLLVRFLIRIWTLPRYARAATRRRRGRRSLKLLARGLRALNEGRWEKAESHLIQGMEHSPYPGLHLVNAARAAQHIGADWRRDRHLEKARDLPRDNTLMVGLTEAELMLEDGQPSKAKATLLELRSLKPKQPRVLELLVQTYKALGEWEQVRELVQELRRRKVMESKPLTELQIETYRELLARVASTGTLPELQALWKQMPKSLQHEEELIIAYAGHLRDLGAFEEAESLLRDAISRQWSDQLIVGYGELGRGDAAAQLGVAENWLKSQPDNPHLLLTLGKLAHRSRQLPKARGYLEQSLRALPTPDAYQELGEILEAMEDKEGALQCYRAAARMLSGRLESKEAEAVLPGAEGKALATREARSGEMVTGPATPAMAAPEGATQPTEGTVESAKTATGPVKPTDTGSDKPPTPAASGRSAEAIAKEEAAKRPAPSVSQAKS
ncbi:MAG: heme biosynthesis HemY N-terminal domain-containing protein [Candidatus Competibacteraceae bacterium]|nr:heme biosynthesis HemY N-terminal domain-containing protein [Candidatus Competibacteraceae bacterium]